MPVNFLMQIYNQLKDKLNIIYFMDMLYLFFITFFLLFYDFVHIFSINRKIIL